jgi:hypothetical protein
MQSAYASLNDTFQRIRRRDGENELLRLLIDMLEAGDIELCKERSGGRVQYWMAARDTSFATRFLAMEDDVRAGIAECFLEGSVVFEVDTGGRLDVRWHIRRLCVN